MTAAVITVSDGVAAGVREDRSGRALVEALHAVGFAVVHRAVVPDEMDRIEAAIRAVLPVARLVVTTGGTGFGPRDVTPEATRRVVERDAPGLVHLMLARGIESTPMAALTRGIVGSVGSTLVVNLPGSPRGATENLAALAPVLGHVLDLLAGHTEHG